MKTSIAKNGMLNAIKTISTVVFPLVTVPYVTRILGADGIGKVNFSNSIIGYFTLLASLGIETYAIKECSKFKGNRQLIEEIASEIFSINCLMMLFSYALLWISLKLFVNLQTYQEIIIILSANIFFGILNAEWINIAFEDFNYITKRTILFQIVSAGLMFLFIKTSDDYITYSAIMMFAVAGPSLMNFVYRERFCKIRLISSMNMQKHIKPILFLFALLLSQSILSNVDITMLGIFIGDKAVGLYSMAFKIYITAEKIVSSVAYVLLPQLTLCFSQRDFITANQLLNKTADIMFAITFPLVIGMMILAEDIMMLVCGQEFCSASSCLVILSIVMFVNIFGGGLWGNLILLPSDREKYFMLACMISALINVVANYLVIPDYGIVGAACTTLFSTLIIFILCKYYAPKQIDIYLSKATIIPVVIGSGVIAVVCITGKYISPLPLFRILFSGICGITLYFGILYKSKHIVITHIVSKLLRY